MFCAVLAAAFEIAARLIVWTVRGPMLTQADSVLGYRMRPNLDVKRRLGDAGDYYCFRTDAGGRRVIPEMASNGRSDRVVILGDSFAFGEGVNDNETCAAILAAKGFPVVNLGAPGYGTNQELLSFREWLKTHRDVSWLFVLVYTNDSDDVRSSYLHMRHKPTASLQDGSLQLDSFHLPWTDRLTDCSFLYALYRTHLTRPVTRPGDGPAIVAACLARLKEEADAVGARSIFLVHDVAQPDRVAPFLDAAATQGVELLDVSETLRRQTDSGETLLCADGMHWNAVAHRMLADELLGKLRSNRAAEEFAPSKREP